MPPSCILEEIYSCFAKKWTIFLIFNILIYFENKVLGQMVVKTEIFIVFNLPNNKVNQPIIKLEKSLKRQGLEIRTRCSVLTFSF